MVVRRTVHVLHCRISPKGLVYSEATKTRPMDITIDMGFWVVFSTVNMGIMAGQ
jgi:hypothetical protein